MPNKSYSAASEAGKMLAAIAAADRQRLGPPPTDVQLQALREGRLPEAEAERLRELMASDPRWAEAYLEMGQDDEVDLARLAARADAEGVDTGAAWRALQARLEAAAPGRRRSWARLLPLAALVLIALGIAWVVARQGSWQGDDGYFVARLEGLRRGDPLDIPRTAAGLELEVSARILDLPGRYSVTVEDSGGEMVASKVVEIAVDDPVIRLRVPRHLLIEEVYYRVLARPDGGPPDAGEVPLAAFAPRFIDP